MADFSFSVVLEPQPDGGYTVLVPALPEVVTEGDTEEEALAAAGEAIRAVLAYRRDHGLTIPDDEPVLRAEVRAGIEALDRGEYVQIESSDLDGYLDRLASRRTTDP